MKRFYRAAMSALAVAAILIGAVSCNEDVSLQGGIDDILLSRHSLSLTVGGEYELTYRILPEDAETDSLAVWSSEDESVVTVEAGLVTAVGTGTAGIVLEIAGKTDRCEVTVSDIQIDSIILSETMVRLPIGGTVQLEATVSPEDAVCDLSWSSDNEGIASVDENGMVTAVSEGLAVIQASAGEVYAKCSIVVEPKEVENVTVDPGELNLKVGEKSELTLTIEPEELADSYVLWASDNENVATVANGTVSAISAGEAVITATVGGMSASCNVSVTNVEVESIVLNYTEYTLKEGETVQLTAVVKPDNATDADVVWSTGDRNVAAVSKDGLVTAVSSGETVITASAGGMDAVCTVTVESDAPVVEWEVGDLYDVEGHDKGIVALVSDTYITVMHLEIGSAQWSTVMVNTDLWDDFTGYGKEGTELLIQYAEEHPGEYPAAEWCASQGGDWYIPSETELLELMKNHEAINAGLEANGGTAMTVENGARYWTCYESDFSAENAKSGYFMEYDWDPGVMYVTNGGRLKTETHYVILIQRIEL